jgi:tetratricopeptide (TPR) repeat protein
LAAFLINENRNADEGISICQGLREKYPGDRYYHFVLSDEGWGYYQKGDFKKALEYLNKAWEMDEGFNIEMYHRLEAAKKAVANQKNN